jgi:hypothetical protein
MYKRQLDFSPKGHPAAKRLKPDDDPKTTAPAAQTTLVTAAAKLPDISVDNLEPIDRPLTALMSASGSASVSPDKSKEKHQKGEKIDAPKKDGESQQLTIADLGIKFLHTESSGEEEFREKRLKEYETLAKFLNENEQWRKRQAEQLAKSLKEGQYREVIDICNQLLVINYHDSNVNVELSQLRARAIVNEFDRQTNPSTASSSSSSSHPSGKPVRLSEVVAALRLLKEADGIKPRIVLYRRKEAELAKQPSSPELAERLEQMRKEIEEANIQATLWFDGGAELPAVAGAAAAAAPASSSAPPSSASNAPRPLV